MSPQSQSSGDFRVACSINPASSFNIDLMLFLLAEQTFSDPNGNERSSMWSVAVKKQSPQVYFLSEHGRGQIPRDRLFLATQLPTRPQSPGWAPAASPGCGSAPPPAASPPPRWRRRSPVRRGEGCPLLPAPRAWGGGVVTDRRTQRVSIRADTSFVDWKEKGRKRRRHRKRNVRHGDITELTRPTGFTARQGMSPHLKDISQLQRKTAIELHPCETL